jgi:ABC-type transporter Mla subunit MlaD
MTTLSFARKLMLGLLSGILALGAALSVAAPTYAAEGTPPATAGEREYRRLERLYERLQRGLEAQAGHLDRADEIAGKVQEFIDKAKGEGKDTSALEAALASATAKVADAQAKHDSAAATLAAHAGFDDDGQVTDAATARQTLESAGRNLRDAHRLLTDARIELRRAIQDFRQANRPARPTATP